MKRLVVFLAAVLFVFLDYALAENYLAVFGVQGFKNPSETAPGVKITKFLDNTIYKADRGSKLIKYKDTAIVDGQEFYLVKFTKVVGTGSDYVEKDRYYYLAKMSFEDYVQRKFLRPLAAFDFGALVVPFKLRFDPTIISPNASIGPYLGYKRYLGFDWSVTFLGTVGLSGITLNDVNAKEPENAMGFTYAGGVVFTYEGRIQIGIIGGSDFIGGEKGEKWTYEHKFWLALSTGFALLK